MAGSSIPHLQNSSSPRSLKKRKSNHDFRILVERKENAPSVDEHAFVATETAPDFTEHQGLLNNTDEVIEIGNYDEKWQSKSSSRTWRQNPKTYCLPFLAILVIIGFFGYVIQIPVEETIEKRYYNGTAWFDSTVIYISLDGFRNDYLDRKVTPNIDLLAEQGIRAEYMNPSFPSITFPNHWTLVTGLYPEAHGIVANEFHDPQLKEDFIHKDKDISSDPKWWGGEPIWVTSKNQGKKSAVIMWPGSNVPIHSVSADYYIPYTSNTTAEDKMDIALGWLDLPITERPQSISMYIPQIDQKGHGGGPEGKQLNGVLANMDSAIGHLMAGLSKRNLQNHVHLVVVSDHGMAQSDKSARLIFYDKILSAESISFLRKREAWPLLGLRPKDDAPDYALAQIYDELYKYTQENDAHYTVYRREEIPARFHYNATERIAPIVMVPDVGYAIILSTDVNPTTGLAKIPSGIHGYDNMAEEMRAIFAARGPQIEKHYVPGTVVKPFVNVEMYRFLTTLLDLDPAPNNATLNGVFAKKELE